MEVITDRDIVYSEARGDKRRARQAKREKRQKGYGETGLTNKEFRKKQKEQRKALKGGTKEERKAGRQERRALRKARRKARRLAIGDRDKDGKLTFKDLIPRVRKCVDPNTARARWCKTNPDGSETEVKEEDVTKTGTKDQNGSDVMVDQNDTRGAQNVQTDDQGNTTVTLNEDQVEQGVDEFGNEGYFRKDDMDEGGWSGLSKGAKIGIIAGGAAVAIVATILIVRAVRKKKGK